MSLYTIYAWHTHTGTNCIIGNSKLSFAYDSCEKKGKPHLVSANPTGSCLEQLPTQPLVPFFHTQIAGSRIHSSSYAVSFWLLAFPIDGFVIKSPISDHFWSPFWGLPTRPQSPKTPNHSSDSLPWAPLPASGGSRWATPTCCAPRK